MNQTFTHGPVKAIADPCPTVRNRWLVERRDGKWKTLIAEVHADPDHSAGVEWQGTKEANAALIASAFNSATQAQDMGFDGIKAVEALPKLLEALTACCKALKAQRNQCDSQEWAELPYEPQALMLADTVIAQVDLTKAQQNALAVGPQKPRW